MTADLVTVVVPARNEADFLDRCLDSVLGQTYPWLEVLVVDGESDDGTADIVRARAARDSRVHLLHNPRRITPVSLNVGLAAARGAWLVRIDGHAAVSPTYVERAVGHLRSGKWSGVGGRVDANGVTPAGDAIAVAMHSRFGIGNSVHHYGTEPVAVDHVPFPGYPVALLRELGGWDESLPTNQDFELDYRIVRSGGRLLYDPEMRIDYHCTQSLSSVFRQFRRYGRGKASVVRLHPGSLRARHLVAPGLVASWPAAAAVATVSPTAAAALFAPYLLGVAAAAVSAGRELPTWPARARLPLAFAAMHCAWGLGFWEGAGHALRGRP